MIRKKVKKISIILMNFEEFMLKMVYVYESAVFLLYILNINENNNPVIIPNPTEYTYPFILPNYKINVL